MRCCACERLFCEPLLGKQCWRLRRRSLPCLMKSASTVRLTYCGNVREESFAGRALVMDGLKLSRWSDMAGNTQTFISQRFEAGDES